MRQLIAWARHVVLVSCGWLWLFGLPQLAQASQSSQRTATGHQVLQPVDVQLTGPTLQLAALNLKPAPVSAPTVTTEAAPLEASPAFAPVPAPPKGSRRHQRLMSRIIKKMQPHLRASHQSASDAWLWALLLGGMLIGVSALSGGLPLLVVGVVAVAWLVGLIIWLIKDQY